jgi:hypothetical protein
MARQIIFFLSSMIFFFKALPRPILNVDPTCFSISSFEVPSTVERLNILAYGVP